MLLITLLLPVLIEPCYSANILGVFPNTGKSHHTLGEVILKKLAKDGHQITMLSKFPQNDPLSNFEDIVLWELDNAEGFIKSITKTSALNTTISIIQTNINETEVVLKNDGVRNLLKSNRTFDLILMDFSTNFAHFIFGHIYNSPIILISACGTNQGTNWIFGNPLPTSYVPHVFRPFTDQMTFYERVLNTFDYICSAIGLTICIAEHEKILKKFFENPPPISHLLDRVELLFSNSFYTFETIRPSVPNVISIGGIHVGTPKRLPQKLEEFLNNSKNGVIYFSLGLNMKSAYLDEEVKEILVKTFSKVNMNVLWKYEADTIENKSANVKLMSWVPQSDLLAHPKVKLFITHGGVLSLIEAIHHAVPFIGMPIFGDQLGNIPRAVKMGYALQVDINHLSEQKLLWAIEEMLGNPKYKYEIDKRSEMMRNRLVHPLNEAIFWVEHILKYGHAKHLKSASVDLWWFQYFLLDIVFVFVVVAIIFAAIISRICKKFGRNDRNKIKIKRN